MKYPLYSTVRIFVFLGKKKETSLVRNMLCYSYHMEK